MVTYYNADGSHEGSRSRATNGPDGLSEHIWYGGAPHEALPEREHLLHPGLQRQLSLEQVHVDASPRPPRTPSISVASTIGCVPTRRLSAYFNNPVFKTLRIDLVTEKKLIDMARRIYDTVLDRTMDQSEVQMLAGYISATAFSTPPSLPTT